MFKKIRCLLEDLVSLKKRAAFMQADSYLQENLYNNPKYKELKRLPRYEHKGFSQHGEDGIIEEIFHRIGTTSRFFVEFGCGKHGTENNSLLLLLKGWNGVWFECNPVHVKRINDKFQSLTEMGRLSVQPAFITSKNINEIFANCKVPKEFDMLSIDIDGNDYWVWQALKDFSPRVVVVEYNAIYPPSMKWIMKEDPKYRWDGSSHFGASLKSFELLGAQKGYKLVGCDFTGVNAFFVREDLMGDHFLAPSTAENHYEPARYFLERQSGHPRNFGEFEI